MAKEFVQLCLFGNKANVPQESKPKEQEELIASLLKEGYEPPNGKHIIQIGLQALPGTQFTFSKAKTSSQGAAALNWSYIGPSGIFDLDLSQSGSTLGFIKFSEESLEIIQNNPYGFLILDLVLESSGQEA